MKNILSIALLLVVSAFTATAQNTVWNLDPSHSMLGFKVKHLVISSVTGKFTEYSVSVKSDKPDFTDAQITVVAKTKSIFTDNNDRDNHLRSDDFFNSEKFPEMTFKSKSIKKTGGNKYKVTGDLTIRNVTKTVTLDMEFGGIVKDPWGNTKAGFSISGEINRFDYNLAWNKAIEAGGLVVDKMVKIECDVELAKAK
ncbi:MAG: polyisoprenoid-binding protein [Candidatus Kapabacteria bacterium]|nr:polyisoprenoid-binding protein [Candidatus Kapabacteria bacterium]MBX7154882.1 YceI family protein [Bacteroidota bacterium]